MEHETNGKICETSESTISFGSVLADSKLPNDILADIQQSNLLLIPYTNFRGKDGVFFPETTTEFFDYLQENSPANVIPDIMASDEDYSKLELHSALVTVASFIVTAVALPIAVNLVSDFLHDLCQKHSRKPDELSAEVNIYVDMKDKSTKITYKGPVSGIRDSLTGAASQLQLICNDSNDDDNSGD